MAVSWMLDGQPVESPAGETILEAAHRAGVEIPSLCWSKSCGGQVRCMVCAVEDEGASRLTQACAAEPQPGMSILTGSPRVLSHRRTTLAWLLGEHRGDCLAPCHLACPAGLDVPLVLASFEAGEELVAREAMAGQLALSEVLGHLCEAPCQKVCHRGRVDKSVAIRSFERVPMAEARPVSKSGPARRVVVVGGGVSGLATAEYLALGGAEVSILEASERLGGSLLQAVKDSRLPQDVLDRALSRLDKLGVRREVGRTIKGPDWVRLRGEFDFLVWATGVAPDSGDQESLPREVMEELGAGGREGKGGWFVVGSALKARRSLAAHVGDARRAAASILGQHLPIFEERFSTSMLPMKTEEWAPFLKRSQPDDPSLADSGTGQPRPSDGRVAESKRCLQCSCSALDSCSLRKLAIAEGVLPVRGGGRRPVGRRNDHSEFTFESGKCMACGMCVAASRKWPQLAGFGWHGRGTLLTVQPPPGSTLQEAVGERAEKLAQLCPTGAMMISSDRRR